MTSPISNSRMGQSSSPVTSETSQQQRVEKALAKMPTAPDAVKSQGASREDLLKASQQVNETLRPYNVRFELNDDSARVVTRIIDQETGDLIRQIPAEAVLKIAERLDEFQGLLLTEEA